MHTRVFTRFTRRVARSFLCLFCPAMMSQVTTPEFTGFTDEIATWSTETELLPLAEIVSFSQGRLTSETLAWACGMSLYYDEKLDC